MKFGSVQFFKRLIVACLLLVLVVPIVLAVVFGVQYAKQKRRADWLETVNWSLLNTDALPENLTNAQEILQYMQNAPEKAEFGPSFDYQKKYPELYVTRPDVVPTGDKVCYLTFDDGPSPVTMQILNVLRDYDIKATFFVTGQNAENNKEILLQEAKAGHTIAVHTYSHEYETIYASVDAYLADFEKMQELITGLTGQNAGIFRFAGGSVNTYNRYIYNEIIAEMTRRGYNFFDWNAAASDAVVGGIAKSEMVNNVMAGAAEHERLVVLMHDRQDNTSTAAALPEVIERLQEQGFRFAPLTADVEPVTFFYQE